MTKIMTTMSVCSYTVILKDAGLNALSRMPHPPLKLIQIPKQIIAAYDGLHCTDYKCHCQLGLAHIFVCFVQKGIKNVRFEHIFPLIKIIFDPAGRNL
jgi:hypothetical protein